MKSEKILHKTFLHSNQKILILDKEGLVGKEGRGNLSLGIFGNLSPPMRGNVSEILGLLIFGKFFGTNFNGFGMSTLKVLQIELSNLSSIPTQSPISQNLEKMDINHEFKKLNDFDLPEVIQNFWLRFDT